MLLSLPRFLVEVTKVLLYFFSHVYNSTQRIVVSSASYNIYYPYKLYIFGESDQRYSAHRSVGVRTREDSQNPRPAKTAYWILLSMGVLR